MKKILLFLLFIASSWIAKGQQNLSVYGNFTNQTQPVVNQQVTITYNSIDSLNPILAYDTTMTDSFGFYYFSKIVPNTTSAA